MARCSHIALPMCGAPLTSTNAASDSGVQRSRQKLFASNNCTNSMPSSIRKSGATASRLLHIELSRLLAYMYFGSPSLPCQNLGHCPGSKKGSWKRAGTSCCPFRRHHRATEWRPSFRLNAVSDRSNSEPQEVRTLDGLCQEIEQTFSEVGHQCRR